MTRQLTRLYLVIAATPSSLPTGNDATQVTSTFAAIRVDGNELSPYDDTQGSCLLVWALLAFTKYYALVMVATAVCRMRDTLKESELLRGQAAHQGIYVKWKRWRRRGGGVGFPGSEAGDDVNDNNIVAITIQNGAASTEF